MKVAMKNLIQKKLLWGVIIIVVTQVLGMLPMLDFIPSWAIKLISFALGVFLSSAKGAEMFYDQSAQLESKTETQYVAQDSEGTITTGKVVTTTQLTPDETNTK